MKAKKFLALILATVLCTMAAPDNFFSEDAVLIYGEVGTAAKTYAKAHNIAFSTEMWQLGDVNKDSNINSSDALMDLQHAVKEIKLEGSDFTRGDVNKDDIVNASDGLLILRYSVKEINHFD